MSVDTSLSRSLICDPAYLSLKQFVIKRTGLAYYNDRDADFARKIQSRLDAQNLPDCGSYFNLLRDEASGKDEFDALVAELTIGETHFFRHREMFDAIRDIVLPVVVERNRHSRRIRVWSAGCSTGAEAYSSSIFIREFLGERANDWDITILATDIDRHRLAHARQGTFDNWALRSLPDEVRARYFDYRDGSWQISPIFAQQVSFQYHNLVEHPFPSLLQNLVAFDFILCRNVMIYFSEEVNRRLIQGFRETLVDGGWLLVGHSEPRGDLFENFHRVLADGAVLYQAPPDEVTQMVSRIDESDTKSNNRDVAQLPDRHEVPTEGNTAGDAETSRVDATPASEMYEPSDQALSEVCDLADRGQLELAARLCQRLLEERKLCPKTNFHYALLMEQAGQLKEAERWLRNAIYLDRRYVLAHYYLGLTYLRRHNNTEAARSFENSLRLTVGTPCDMEIEGTARMTVGDLRRLAQKHLSLLAEQ